MEATPNRIFPCMEGTYPYAKMIQRKVRNAPSRRLELVLYGIRELA